MTISFTDISRNKTARIAGILWFMLIVTGIFAEFFVRSGLIVPGDAAATAGNILANEWLFRVGIVSDLFMGACFVLLAWTLYILLKPVNKDIALLFVVIAAISITIQCINMVNQIAALQILTSPGLAQAFSTGQLHALMMFFLDMHRYGYTIDAIFYGGWLFPLGYLAYQSGFLPKISGILLMAACIGDWIGVAQVFLFPGFEVITYPGFLVAVIAEFTFCGWLMVKGVKESEPVLSGASS